MLRNLYVVRTAILFSLTLVFACPRPAEFISSLMLGSYSKYCSTHSAQLSVLGNHLVLMLQYQLRASALVA